MNKENLKKVLTSIKLHGPEHFDMSYWFRKVDEFPNDNGDYIDEIKLDDIGYVDIKDCGTTACIAGHAALVMVSEGIDHLGPQEVGDWIGLEFDEDYKTANGDGLLYKENWRYMGDPYEKAFNIAKDQGDYAGAVYLLEQLIKGE